MRKILFLLGFFLLPVFGYADGGNFRIESSSNVPKIEKRKSIVSTILTSFSTTFTYKALSVIIDDALVEPRGRIKGNVISLSAKVLKDGEFIQLFAHEFAHYVDLYILTSVAGQDNSDIFYKISWKETDVKLPGEGVKSFVSGYASTNKYEDFAESFTFYVFHNAYFADRAIKNESLRQKYLFFSQYVFPDEQFMGTDFSLTRIPDYIWDTTKTQISLQKYLYSLH